MSSFHFAPPVDVVRCALTKGFTTGKVGLPVLPEIAGRVIALANDLNTEIEDLCELIEQDQALAANILRYANSAAFAIGERVNSLHEAMMRMGMTMVSSIAVAACLEGKEFHTPAYDGYRRRVRAHALTTASLARDLARRLRCSVELAFMCALMHSIGKPVVLRLLADVQKSAHVRIGEAEAIILAEEYELNAAETAVKAWNLPQHVQVAACYYKRPEAAPEYGRETTITALAARLAGWIVENNPAEEAAVRALPEWPLLPLEDDAVDEIIEHAQSLRGASPAEMF
jgi:putative nucleotidyltransferase with HDIG domain